MRQQGMSTYGSRGFEGGGGGWPNVHVMGWWRRRCNPVVWEEVGSGGRGGCGQRAGIKQRVMETREVGYDARVQERCDRVSGGA
jgi:hypothetical protein